MPNDKYAPQARYNAKTRKRVCINLNTNTDQDILTFLDQVSNVQGYLKSLIRADMCAHSSAPCGEKTDSPA